MLLAKFNGYRDAFDPSEGIVRIGMSSWRGAHLPGVAAEAKTKKKTSEKTAVWKRAATARVMQLWPDLDTIRFGANDPALRPNLVKEVRAAADAMAATKDGPSVTVLEGEPIDVVVVFDRDGSLN